MNKAGRSRSGVRTSGLERCAGCSPSALAAAVGWRFNSRVAATVPVPQWLGRFDLQIEPPYLIFLGDARDGLAAKTGQGIVDWRPERALGQLRFPGCGADLGIPDWTIGEAAARGVKSLVIGAVNSGGLLPAAWTKVIVEALRGGLDVASGLHTRLESFAEVADAARTHGRRLFDVRHSDRTFQTGTGEKRSGKRLLTVGTDCSVGKKYTALAIERELRCRNVDVDFRATGQTGILITGRGVAVDAVAADFIAGAVEWLSPVADENHWDVIEGQGSLFHPAFAGVSMGLLHGAQPDAFVVCHEPTRATMRNVAAPIPSVDEVIDLTVRAGRATNPAVRCTGIALNTQNLGAGAASALIDETAARLSLPVSDPMRFGAEALVDHLLDSC